MIIQKLLLIESEAQEAMRMLEKEKIDMAKKAEAELTRRVLELENVKNAKLYELRQATEEKTLATITKIEAEYEHKRSELVKTFADNRKTWGDNIFHDVLHETSLVES